MEKPAEQDPRVYFAAERTFLAWIRTGLGLMGIGFAVARFGLFLRQLYAAESHLPPHSTRLSLWSGVGLVVLGVIVNVAAVFRHINSSISSAQEPGNPAASPVTQSSSALSSPPLASPWRFTSCSSAENAHRQNHYRA
jgi:uncharacterized membrane protein YidH (DUF202 family)